MIVCDRQLIGRSRERSSKSDSPLQYCPHVLDRILIGTVSRPITSVGLLLIEESINDPGMMSRSIIVEEDETVSDSSSLRYGNRSKDAIDINLPPNSLITEHDRFHLRFKRDSTPYCDGTSNESSRLALEAFLYPLSSSA